MRHLALVWAINMVLAGVVVGRTAQASVMCEKKSGVVFVRSTACKRHETSLDLSQFGATGPAGPMGLQGLQGLPGSQGLPGTARAYAVCDRSTTPVSALNITSISHPSTGIYCLTPAAGIDTTTSVTMVSVEWYHSSGNSLVAFVVLPVSNCGAGTFEVQTYDFTGSASDNVAFVFAVL